MSKLHLEILSGPQVGPIIPELARLRTLVFREYPYLYQGSLQYEQHYLQKFLDLSESTVVVVHDGKKVVGASTALPLLKAEAEFQGPFVQAGLSPQDWYYFGESVLERAYRGQGIGKQFFLYREARARELGYPHAAFCAVTRPPDHPRKPQGYRPLDEFWQGLGYTCQPSMVCHFSWQDLDQEGESPKPMVFWTKVGL
jgi:GNAT superfamily N-acetyltransferase